ncbi:MAG: hypothetical protein AAF542_24090 [Pseudomonadota bacterium]
MQTNEVVLQFFSNAEMTSSYSRGLQVIVYGADHQSISRTIEVDSTGEASLGDFEQDVSISLIYTNDSIDLEATPVDGLLPVIQRRHIRSVLDLPVEQLENQDGRFFIRLSTQSNFVLPAEPVVRNLTLTVIADGEELYSEPEREILRMSSQPQLQAPAAVFEVFGGTPTCETNINDGRYIKLDGQLSPNAIQNDGNVSFLSFLNVGFRNSIERYGFSLDQEPVNGADYSTTTNLIPTPIDVDYIGYSIELPDGTSVADARSSSAFFAIRQGVQYSVSSNLNAIFDLNAQPSLSSSLSACSSSADATLQIDVADQFPVDHYVLWHLNTHSDFPRTIEITNGVIPNFITTSSNACYELSASTDLPDSVELQANGLDIGNIEFSTGQQTMLWQAPTPESVRHTRITLHPAGEDPIYGLWTIDATDSNDQQIQLPALPPELAEVINPLFEEIPARMDLEVFDHLPALNTARHATISSLSVGESLRQCRRQQSRHEINL